MLIQMCGGGGDGTSVECLVSRPRSYRRADEEEEEEEEKEVEEEE